MNQIKKGAFLSYSTIVLSTFVGLLLTPIIISSLGDSEYGLYSLIGSLVGYLSVLDFGLNNTVVRFVSKYRAEKNLKEEQNFLALTLRIYLVLSFLIVAVGSIIYANLDVIFSKSFTVEELGTAKVMFAILLFNLGITLPGGVLTAICSGYEQFVFPRAVNIIRYILRSLAVVALLFFDGDAIGIILVDTAFNLLVIIVTGVYVFGVLKVKLRLHIFSLAKIKGILSFSVWVFLYAIVHQFQWNAGQVVVGMNMNTENVAIFAIGTMLSGFYAAFGGVLNSVLIPKANQLVVSKQNGLSLTNSMIKYARINAIIMMFILGGFFLFGKEFIYLWVGESYELSYYIGLVIMVSLTILIIQGFGNLILEANKKNRFKSLLSISTVSISVIVGYYMSHTYGILGVAIPLSMAILLNGIVMNFYFKKIFDFQLVTFLKGGFIPLILLQLVLVGVSYWLKYQLQLDSWYLLILGIAVYCVLYALVAYLFMNKSEKNIILNRSL